MKLFLTLSLLLVTGLVVGCTMSSEQEQDLNDAAASVWSGVESGELTINEAKSLITEIEDARGADVPWWEIIGTMAFGIALRGVPSKGIIAGIFGTKK